MGRVAVYRLTKDAIVRLQDTSFADKGLSERGDLQRLLRANISVVAPDVLVIAEEFGDWEASRRRIDLLGIDREGRLVVFELKRGDDGGHIELQAIRYAAMVSRTTFQGAVDIYQNTLEKQRSAGGLNGARPDARAALSEFLGRVELPADDEVLDVRIVLVSAGFDKEVTTAVLWLREWDLDIRCVRIRPYRHADEVILEVETIVPLREADEYITGIRKQAKEQRDTKRPGGEPTGYWFMNTGDGSGEGRSWEDCKQYGFMLAGGGEKWINDVRKLRVGDKVFAYLSRFGYVGVGEVVAEAVPFNDFTPAGQARKLKDLPLRAKVQTERMADPDRADWCAAVRWIRALDRDDAVLKNRSRRSTVERIKQPELVAELLEALGARDAAGSA